MKMEVKRLIAWLLVAAGICIVAFSSRIVFPGPEVVLGIEALVGKQSVVYLPDGGYIYTNPGAMIGWISGVAGVGVLISAIGIALLVRASRRRTV